MVIMADDEAESNVGAPSLSDNRFYRAKDEMEGGFATGSHLHD